MPPNHRVHAGTAYFVSAISGSRYGIEKLPAVLTANGFVFTHTQLPPALVPDDDAWPESTGVVGAGMPLQLFTVQWRPHT